jgi:acetyl esterase
MINPHVPPAGIAPLDEPLRTIEQRIRESGRFPIGFDITGPEARARAAAIAREFYPELLFDVAEVTDMSIAGPAGDLRIRVQRPLSATTATVVFFHGGSWVVGDLDSHRGEASRIAAAANAVVVQVDYRLAPEHPFPAAVDDACAAVEWAFENIARLGGDPSKVAVAGDSSGGNLAAVAAQHCRAVGLPLAAQLLLYPVTFLGEFARQLVGRQYLGDHFDTVGRDIRLSPAYADHFNDLAPAIVGVGAHDFLFDDNIAYARLLRDAGVPTLLREYPTLNHGFFSNGRVSAAADAAASELCRDLGAILHASDGREPEPNQPDPRQGPSH